MPVSTENSTSSRSNDTSTRDTANDSTRGNDTWWESMSATRGISVWTSDTTTTADGENSHFNIKYGENGYCKIKSGLYNSRIKGPG